MIGLLISFARAYLVRRAEKKLRHMTDVNIPSSVKLNGASVHLLSGCKVSIGDNSEFGGRISFDRENGEVSIGAQTFIGASSFVVAERIEIGSDVLISWGCTFVDHDSHSIHWDARQHDVVNWLKGIKDWTHVPIAPVKICDKVWIGFNATILKGITIGEGAVVGAGSVVTKDVPPYSVVAGNPARVVRKVNDDE